MVPSIAGDPKPQNKESPLSSNVVLLISSASLQAFDKRITSPPKTPGPSNVIVNSCKLVCEISVVRVTLLTIKFSVTLIGTIAVTSANAGSIVAVEKSVAV